MKTYLLGGGRVPAGYLVSVASALLYPPGLFDPSPLPLYCLPTFLPHPLHSGRQPKHIRKTMWRGSLCQSSDTVSPVSQPLCFWSLSLSLFPSGFCWCFQLTSAHPSFSVLPCLLLGSISAAAVASELSVVSILKHHIQTQTRSLPYTCFLSPCLTCQTGMSYFSSHFERNSGGWGDGSAAESACTALRST